MTTINDKVVLHLHLPVAVKSRLKMLSASTGASMTEIVIHLVNREFLELEKRRKHATAPGK